MSDDNEYSPAERPDVQEENKKQVKEITRYFEDQKQKANDEYFVNTYNDTKARKHAEEIYRQMEEAQGKRRGGRSRKGKKSSKKSRKARRSRKKRRT